MGRFTLRIPDDWHKALRLMSAEEEDSINKIVKFAIKLHPRFFIYLDRVKELERKQDLVDGLKESDL